ncbi:MAG: SDR family NAD(P)-dependent oxidoreductase, partial [Erysipelotrichia bacterium]|nr:SDR family NAD(P)-dependent oxidoreductase [Erysipelotrichia bacterium]
SNTEIKKALASIATLTTPQQKRKMAAESRKSFNNRAQCRLAFVIESGTDLNKLVSEISAQLDKNTAFTLPNGACFSFTNTIGPVGVIFPGQGAQYPGMGRDIACASPEAFTVLAEADKEISKIDADENHLVDYVFPRPTYDPEKDKLNEERLRATDIAQPAIGAIALGHYRALEAFGMETCCFAGHSYGELVSLCAAGAFDSATLARLSRKRGQLMAHRTGDRGGMIAVSGDKAAIEALLAEEKIDLVVANHNSPQQVVLSGKTEEIERSRAIFKQHKIRATVLNVAGAFHSSFVADAAEPFHDFLKQETIKGTRCPVYANTTAEAYPQEPDAIKKLLGFQLANQVRFVEIIERMYDDGVRTFVEAGPGGKMTGLIKAILEGRECNIIAVDSSAGKRSGMTDLARVLAQLSALGHKLDIEKWNDGKTWLEQQPKDGKPRMTFPICGANYKSNNLLKFHQELAVPGKPQIAMPPKTPALQPTVSSTQPIVSTQVNVAPAPVAAHVPRVATQSSATTNTEALRLSRETLSALQQLQQQTADLHRRFLEGQEQAQKTILTLISGNTQTFTATPATVQPIQQTATALQPQALQNVAPAITLPTPTPVSKPTPTLSPAVVNKPAADTNKLRSVLIDVVSEKTGYPSEMLNLDMDMEADLGIDSIKRVEIMSAMQERLPDAPVVQPDQLGKLRTLTQILEHLSAGMPATAPAVAHQTHAAAPAKPTANIQPVLIEIVSEKTGYPAEMLNLDMDMEADLGIDSIKRVEIMSAMQERLPDAPVVQPDQLGKLRTLTQILEHLSAGMPATATVAGHQTHAAAPARPTANIQPVLIEIVSEKTGYPAEMLNLDMDMEADLGIDSIKRVEIMSAMQERLPDAPVVQPDQLGKLRTLAQILEHLSAGMPATAPAVAHQTHAAAPSKPTANIQPVLIEIVSEKTGYPAEMLNLDMDMEADLGIDSIKRVEIMSAVQERLPDAPVIQPDQLGKLRTLAQIIEFISGAAGISATAAPALEHPLAEKPSTKNRDEILIEVIADKTGYPTDMLSLEMDMEADLGIDSIKRVEILSAFQEKVPDAPVVQPGDLGKFRTIAQIIEYLNSGMPSAKQPAISQTASTQAKSASNSNPLKRTVLKAIELSAETHGSAVLDSGSSIIVSDDDAELADAVCTQLAGKNMRVDKLSLLQIAAGNFPKDTKGLVIIAPLPEKASMNLWEEQSEEWLKDAFMAAQKAGPQIRANGKGLIATVSRLDGTFALESATRTVDPVQGGLAGLAKTIRYEWPELISRAIDLDYRFKDNNAAATKLVDELLHQTGPIEVGLTRSGRYGLSEVESQLTENSSAIASFQKGDVVVVTGGARGVTAETAFAFAEKYQTTMVLIGRSPAPQAEPAWLSTLSDEPAIKGAILKNSGKKLTPKELEAEFKSIMANREVLHNLAKIRNTGGKVFYYSADIRNAEEVEKIIEQARSEAGTITGLIHGAGVLRDRRIEDKTREQLDDVINTKVSGLRNVLKALVKDNLKAIVLFSSFSGRGGRLGQVDYAMANEVLNKAAQKLRILRPECRVMSFNWGPWDGGMVTPALRNVFIAEGIGLIPLREGSRQPIVELTNASESAVEIGIIGTLEEKGANDPEKKFLKAFDFELNIKENAWLKDHVLNGEPVLPMAVATELLVEAAVLMNPGLCFIGYDDMRILKGVVLKNSQQNLNLFASRPEKTGDGCRIICELRTITAGKEVVNARATVLLAEKLPTDVLQPAHADANLVYPDSINEAYKNHLFHGDFFKSLTRVGGWSENGIVASTKTSRPPSQWFARPVMNKWCTEPMSVDAAYQLMILWTTQAYGLPSLPGYAKKYRQYVSSFTSNEIVISARTRRSGTMMALADIDFIDHNGNLLARIEGYECTMNENLNNAFKLRSVSGAE